MTHHHNLDAVGRVLENLLRPVLSFGGIIVPWFGDFRQILRVVRTAIRFQIVSACFKKSCLFSLFNRTIRHENLQLQTLTNDPNAVIDAFQFRSYLLKIGKRTLQSDVKQALSLTSFLNKCESFVNMMQHIFLNLEQYCGNGSGKAEWAVVNTGNERWQLLRIMIGRRLSGNTKMFLITDFAEEA